MPRSVAPTFLASVVASSLPSPIAVKTSSSIAVFSAAVSWYAFSELKMRSGVERDFSSSADAHQIPPTHFRSTTSRNIDTRRHVPVNDGVSPGFRGVCDTVLTQRRHSLTLSHSGGLLPNDEIDVTIEHLQ